MFLRTEMPLEVWKELTFFTGKLELYLSHTLERCNIRIAPVSSLKISSFQILHLYCYNVKKPACIILHVTLEATFTNLNASSIQLIVCIMAYVFFLLCIFLM